MKIGDFSKVCRVSVKTLRYYDTIGLLSPDQVDSESGYRYYHPSKVMVLSEIFRLKEIGFSLEEIRRIRSEEVSAEEMISLLEEQRVIAEDEIYQAKMRAQKIDLLIETCTEGAPMEPVKIKELPHVTVASYRVTIPDYNALFDVAPASGEIMKKQGAVCIDPPYCFNIYHDDEYRETDIDLEICEAVEKACDDGEGVVYKEIEGVKTAACIDHKGSYDSLSSSYGELLNWIEENGYEVSGKSRESYIDGIWNKEDSRDWLTEIQIPVEKREL